MFPNYAVIDLGTNTFHLLVVQSNEHGKFIEQHRERIFVKLADKGITRISDQAYARGLHAMVRFRQLLDEHQVDNIRAIGTAALRTASNGPAFIADVWQKTRIGIQLIDGQEEARLIHLGVNQAVDMEQDNSLIMDVGGGSVEFIIADRMGVKWAESFPIGVAVLFQAFHTNDPITPQEVQAIFRHLDQMLVPLFTALEKHPTTSLIGASGTFDVLENLLANKKDRTTSARVEIDAFHRLYQHLLPTSLVKRKAMATIPDDRIDMIIVALILIEYIIKKADSQEIIVSAYAMKEGILYEMITEQVDKA